MLKTLSEIRSMSVSEVSPYFHFLWDNHGWTSQEATTLLTNLRNTPEAALPVPDSLLVYLCYFLEDNYWNDNAEQAQIENRIERRTFTSDDVAIFVWVFNGRNHSIVVSKGDADFLSDFTDHLSADADLNDLYVDRFGSPDPDTPRLDTLDTNLVDYMRELGIISTPEYLELNSESLEVKENTARFSGAMWYEAIQQKIITLAGVGGIGRFGNLE